MPQVESVPGSWRLGHGLVIGAILLVAVMAGWGTRAPVVGLGGDEATYVILSGSLGQGRYHDEFLVGTPPHAKYPPGMPLWIGLVRRVAGPDLDNLRAANLVLLALTALLIGDAIRRISGPWPGVAGVALTAMSPGLLELAGTALSEVPFTFLVVVAVWMTLLADSDQRGRPVAVALGAAVASFLTRSVGITAVAGVIAWLMARRRWRAAGVSLLFSGLAIGGWFGYTALFAAVTDGVSSYGRDLSHIASTGPGGPAGLLTQATTNAREYLLVLPASLGVPTIPGTPIDNLVWIVVLAGCGLAGMLAVLRKWPAAGAHLLLSFALLLVWPWPIQRLVVPLLPLIGAALLVGSFELAGKAGRGARMIVPLALAALLSISGLREYLARDIHHLCDRANPFDDPGCFPPENRNMVRALHLVRDSAPPGTVIATGKPATVFYFSGHPTVPLAPVLRSQGEPPEDAGPAGNAWILLSELEPQAESAARRLLGRGCDRYGVRARIPRAILLFPGALPGLEGDACTAIRRFILELPR